MRDILTGLAILLLLCLTGALVAPHFITWENHREQISAYVSEAVGQKVQVDGAIGITLFPTLALKLGQVKLDDGAAVSGEISRLRLTGSIPPLLRGELKIASAVVDSAKLVVRPEKLNASVISKNDPLNAISIENLLIRSSAIQLQKADGSLVSFAENANGQLEAASLAGPFKGGLSFLQGDQVRTFRFSTGRIEEGVVRLKALVENELAANRSEFDGQIAASRGVLSAEGKLTASGNATLPLEGVPQVIWRMTSKVRGNSQSSAFDDIELFLGQGDRQAVFAGNGTIDFNRALPAQFIFSTRQIDIDKLLSDENQRLPKTPEALLQLVTVQPRSAASVPWLSGEVEFSAGSLILGRGIISAPRAVLAFTGGITGFKELSGELPGQTNLRVEAIVESNTASVSRPTSKPSSMLSGKLNVESRDFNKLNTWYHGVLARAAGPRSVKLSGTVLHSENVLGVSNASLQADEFRASGSVMLHRNLERPKLEMRLEADQLDIARLPTIADLDGPDTMDLDVILSARKVQLSGVGAGQINVKARREAGAVLLDSFSIHDLGGANLQMSGGIGRVGSRLDAELDATNLDALLQLASRVSAHNVIPALIKRAPDLVPARVQFSLAPDKAEAKPAISSFPTFQMELRGKIAETEISGFLRLNDNAELLSGKALDVTLSANDTSRLLRQVGLEAIRLDHAGPTRLALVGEGFPAGEKAANWSLKGEIARVNIEASATRVADPVQPLSGQLSISAQDLSPLAQTLLIAVPTVAPGQSLKATAGFDLRGYKITLRDLDARSNEGLSQAGFIRGELAFNLAEFGRVAGQLQTSELDIRSFAPLIFGSNDNTAANGMWSPAPFGKVSPVTLPGDLWIEAQSVRLGDDVRTDRTSFVLRFENGLIYLEHAEAEANGSRLKGAATLRRLDKAVSLTGRVGVTGGMLSGRPFESVIKGRFEGELDFNGIADSPASLVASLSGTGRTKLMDASLLGVRHGAVSNAVRASLGFFDATLPDALADRLKADLEGTTGVPAVTVPVVLSGGVLRAGPIPVTTAEEELATNIAVDFKDFNLRGESVVRLREQPKDWDGGTASASVIWQGPLSNPIRRVESTALANGLTAIAITRESQRIELLEREQRERATLNRQLQISQEEQRQLLEEKRRLDEARRLQAARRRAEEQVRQRTAPAPRVTPSESQIPASPTLRPMVITPPAAR